jgi:5'-3' exoribonuclease 1
MDADLIMLSLVSGMPKFYILREEPMSNTFSHYFIDMGETRKQLGELMLWNSPDYEYDVERAITDFVFMCFTVGNDFLPHIPAVEIAEGGIDSMLDIYKTVGASYGHLTKKKENGSVFRKKALSVFLGAIGNGEKNMLQEKASHMDRYIHDPVLMNNVRVIEGKYELNMETYKQEYYESNMPEVSEKEMSFDYLEGMQWVLTYYTYGVPSWEWRYPHHYAPFASTLAKYVEKCKRPVYEKTVATLPFVQLLSVLPPTSAELLPEGLSCLFKEDMLKKYCPDEFVVDTAGCKNDWEGTVILPMVDYSTVKKEFIKNMDKVDKKELRRNVVDKNKVYKKSEHTFMYKSFYGDFVCGVNVFIVDF